MAASGGETSQTLDRGLTVLKLLAKSQDGLTVADIADELGTARPIVYRLLRTLEGHNLVSREDSRYVLGFGVAELAGNIKPRLQATVLPILRGLSRLTGSTALLSVADGEQALDTAGRRTAGHRPPPRDARRSTPPAHRRRRRDSDPRRPPTRPRRHRRRTDGTSPRLRRHRRRHPTRRRRGRRAHPGYRTGQPPAWASSSSESRSTDQVSEAVAPAVMNAAEEAATRLSGTASGKAVNQ